MVRRAKIMTVFFVVLAGLSEAGTITVGTGPVYDCNTIQAGIDAAVNGDTVLVWPGVYSEEIDFLGKAITVKSAADAAVVEAPGGFAVSFYSGEEPNSVLKNFAIRNSYMGIFVAGSSPTISNVTVVDNEYGVAAVWAEPNIISSIFWNNAGGDLFECQARYSDTEEGCPGEGNISVDPLLVDSNNGDYHLLSGRGRYWPTYDVWVLDEVTSPCIDAGDPAVNARQERKPNGGRINMGAYGGTAYASMSKCWIASDINCDGVVNMMDFAILADNWLKYEPPTDEFEKPGLAKYYVPYDNPAEPSAPGYSLPLNLGAVGNYAYMNSRFGLSNIAPLLEQNGFAVMEYDFHDSNDIVKPYEYLRKMDVPLFVTADTLLHLYHVQFDETLKDVEEREFYGDIRDLTAALLDEALGLYEEYTGDLKEAARRNVAYLAVAQKLIDPNAEVPQLVTDVVASELAKIDAHAGFAPSDIFIYKEDYSQYIPRGHYTRSEELKRYFRTLMWYGRMAFLLKGAESWGPMGDALISVYDAKVQTMQAVLLATSIEEVKVGARSGREIWNRLYAVTSFYVGLADDLTPYEYLGAVNKVFGSSFVATDLLDEDDFFALKVKLALLRSPKINGGTGDIYPDLPLTPQSLNEVLDKTKGMRFMGQRFIPDSYMFQQLVTPKVLSYTGDGNPIPFSYGTTPALVPHRCYPRGLDVMAILGSARAKTILVEGGDTDFVDYWPQFDEIKAEFDAFDISDWNRNLYWSWLYSLRALIDELVAGYPNFMRTEAWQKKELNAALASWTELRHDTILYAKQSYTPPPPNGGPPDVTGYVEPVPEFYGRLLALTRMTRQGLSDLDALSVQATERLVNLEDILSRLIEIANKELMNQTLSDDDYKYIMGFGKTLEGAVIGVEEKGVKTTLVADVHTYSFEAQVVEEGVGYVDLIIVACPIADGSIVLSAGPVLSYYEFKHPMSDRLTDEAWRELLDSAQRPDRPTWWFQQSLPVLPPPVPPPTGPPM